MGAKIGWGLALVAIAAAAGEYLYFSDHEQKALAEQAASYEEQLAKVFRTRLKDGREVADGATVGTVLTDALKSVAALHQKNPDVDLARLRPAVDKLAQSNNPVLRSEAERTLIVLNRK